MNEKLSVAIVGAGASGTLTAINLLKSLQQPATVYLIEKRKESLFRGAAYNSTLDYEPLNVPVGKMSLYNSQPDDFYAWILSNNLGDEEITRDSFVSRRWFGNYLEENLKLAANHKHPAVNFNIIHSTTVDIDCPGNYLLKQDDGTEIEAHYVILATGNEKPNDVLSSEAKEVLGANYYSNPWHFNALENLQSEDTVLLIGTGLTTVDYLVSLKKRKHTGKVYALSLNGLLPKTHNATVSYKVETPLKDDNIHRLFEKLSIEIEKAKQKNINWRSVIDAMRADTAALWQGLSHESKLTFLKEYRTQWEIHRHRMPLASANEIKTMIADKQVEILTGSIGEVIKNGNGYYVYYQTQANEKLHVKANRVINCTGPSGDYEKSDNELLKNLLKKNWLKKDVYGLGVITGRGGELINADGGALKNMFAVGPLRKASEWESTALREIRNQAEEIAAKLSIGQG